MRQADPGLARAAVDAPALVDIGARWYDRAGLGQSDPAPTPRTVGDLVQDLRTLLQRARISGPYVLAGHSLGGLTVRLYCDRYPAEVAALVLIELGP